MNLKNSATAYLLMILLCCVSNIIHAAAQAKFLITPTADATTSWLLPSNFTETIQYQVTNQTQVTYQLMMTPISGVTQVTTGTNVCAQFFTLKAKESCLLTLQIDGSQIPSSGIHGGPVICKTNNSNPDPFLCSKPSTKNTLAVSSTAPGEHIYVTNAGADSLTMCQVNPATARLSNCDTAATGLSLPEAVTINPTGNFLYVANPGNNTISLCQRDTATGTLSGCGDAGGTGFLLPSGVTVNPQGDILYISNGGNLVGVSACDINPTTGSISKCNHNTSSSFDNAFDITLNTSGTHAYVANFTDSSVAVCEVHNKRLLNCQAVFSSTFSGPEGVTVDPLSRFLYVANNTSNQVSVCGINNTSNLPKNCEITDGQFSGIGNVGLSQSGTSGYVPDFIGNRLFHCHANSITGALSACLNLEVSGLNNPAGIVLK
ncbi:MAG: beta-propeller fold lactonase family protein [Gammaproteobacteria bacterium]|nr:beta-propeller fold lactonase family protein [Gammaproteobacteria bacterium]MCH9717441.1 beta-propeller fold lactonase family protein [Gammaproteobacteria bacterium]MCH9763373.1 beta-propeller fold lactonase family protein [Gammaproteobacteria bacterium]